MVPLTWEELRMAAEAGFDELLRQQELQVSYRVCVYVEMRLRESRCTTRIQTGSFVTGQAGERSRGQEAACDPGTCACMCCSGGNNDTRGWVCKGCVPGCGWLGARATGALAAAGVAVNSWAPKACGVLAKKAGSSSFCAVGLWVKILELWPCAHYIPPHAPNTGGAAGQRGAGVPCSPPPLAVQEPLQGGTR